MAGVMTAESGDCDRDAICVDAICVVVFRIEQVVDRGDPLGHGGGEGEAFAQGGDKCPATTITGLVPLGVWLDDGFGDVVAEVFEGGLDEVACGTVTEVGNVLKNTSGRHVMSGYLENVEEEVPGIALFWSACESLLGASHGAVGGAGDSTDKDIELGEFGGVNEADITLEECGIWVTVAPNICEGGFNFDAGDHVDVGVALETGRKSPSTGKDFERAEGSFMAEAFCYEECAN